MRRALTSLLALCLAGPAAAATIVRGPYVQDVGQSSLVIAVRLSEPAALSLEVGATDALGTTLRSAAALEHAFHVDGRAPGSALHYRVEGETSSHVVLLAPEGPAPVRFCVVGDMGSGDDRQAAVAARLVAQRPDLVLCVGDIVYPHGADEGYDARFFAPYRALLPEVPFYPVLGNHDMHTANGAPYLAVFHLPTGAGQERFYSFDRGEVHFVGLDSNADLAPDGAQSRWLEADLAASKLPVKVAYFHHPAFTNGRHGEDEEESRAMRGTFVPILARHGVQLVLAGHDHDYERLAPRDGIQFFVSGSGGAGLRPFTPGPDTLHADDTHHQTTCFASDGHAGLAFEAVAADGTVLDAGTLLQAGKLITAPPAPLGALPQPAAGGRGSGCGCSTREESSREGSFWFVLLALAIFRRQRLRCPTARS